MSNSVRTEHKKRGKDSWNWLRLPKFIPASEEENCFLFKVVTQKERPQRNVQTTLFFEAYLDSSYYYYSNKAGKWQK